jgi:uncharacterized protein with PIN domain
MDSELSTRISGVVRQLAEQEHHRLRAAGTFVELEELACEIGDEVTRQLMSGQLVDRSNEAADAGSQPCPDCGQSSSQADTQHRKLASSRGPIEYYEPAYHCPSCRRAFFPGSRLDRLARASHGNSEVDRKNGMGGK